MDEEKLGMLMKAHRIGVEDMKTGVRMLLREVTLSNEDRVKFLKSLDEVVVLPSRLYSEIIAKGLVR